MNPSTTESQELQLLNVLKQSHEPTHDTPSTNTGQSSTTMIQSLAPMEPQQDPFEEYQNVSDEDVDMNQVDLGVAQNKKRQLSRFDFDTHEEWVSYKDSQVHLPKAAFQFGVKYSQGRTKKMKAKGSGGYDVKLNREMQQLDKVYKEKYGSKLLVKESKSNSSK